MTNLDSRIYVNVLETGRAQSPSPFLVGRVRVRRRPPRRGDGDRLRQRAPERLAGLGMGHAQPGADGGLSERAEGDLLGAGRLGGALLPQQPRFGGQLYGPAV